MGNNTLETKSAGQTISQDDVNQYKTAMNGDLVPRNTSGAPTTDGGNLGNSTYAWKKADITTGYLFPGQVIMFHDFNGTLTPGQGWMKLNGDVVNSTTYDAIHGAGSWTTYIGSSSLSGLNLPDSTDKYPVGTASTAQDGSSPITYDGNASNQIDFSHTHTMNTLHNHKWHRSDNVAGNLDFSTFTSAGAEQSYTRAAVNVGGASVFITGGTSGSPTSEAAVRGATDTNGECYTDNDGASSEATSSSLSATQNIQPHSFAVEYWIRII